MNRFCRYTALITLSCLVMGCPPEKRIVWSHDGRRAAVCADNSLHFIDADGKVLAPRLDAKTTHCTWLKDNKHVLVVHIESVRSWNEIAKIATADQISIIKERAADLKKSLMAYEGDWDKFDISFKNDYSPGTTAAILFYLRDNLAEGVQQKLAAKWSDLEKMELEVNVLQLLELNDTNLRSGKVLMRSLDGIGGVSVARSQNEVAFVTRNLAERDGKLTLFTLNVSGGSPNAIASNVGTDCAWSPDDRKLAYFKCMTGDSSDLNNLQLGVLTFATVTDESGNLSRQPVDEREEIGVLFNGLWSIHWLSDGRLLFSSVEVTLPATNADMPRRWGLFMYDPRMPSTVTRVFARSFDQSLQESFPRFELSPDEHHALMLGAQGEVITYDLTTGKSQVLATDPCTSKGGSPQMVPVWIANDEVCYDICIEGADGGDQRRQVVLWKDGKTRTLSVDWPEEMTKDWLVKNRTISTQGSEEE